MFHKRFIISSNLNDIIFLVEINEGVLNYEYDTLHGIVGG